MNRAAGARVPRVIRNQAIQLLQSLVAAGVDDAEARSQVAQRFNVTPRTARNWLVRAYRRFASEVPENVAEIRGLALRRRRIVLARAARENDWKTYLQAAVSEAKLLGLDQVIDRQWIGKRFSDLLRLVITMVREFAREGEAPLDDIEEVLRYKLTPWMLGQDSQLQWERESPNNEVLIDAGAADSDSEVELEPRESAEE